MSNYEINIQVPVEVKCPKCQTIGTAGLTRSALRNCRIIVDAGLFIAPNINCPICGNAGFEAIGQVFMIIDEKIVSIKMIHELKRLWGILFKSCNIKLQKHGLEGSVTVGSIDFIIADGDDFSDPNETGRKMTCIIRHAASPDKDFAETELEVEVPEELKSRVTHEEFSKAVNLYYEYVIGPDGFFVTRSIQVSPNITVENFTVNNSKVEDAFHVYIPKTDRYSNKAW